MYLGWEILLPGFLLLISIPFTALSPRTAHGCSCQGPSWCCSMTLWRGEPDWCSGSASSCVAHQHRDIGSYTSQRRGMRQRQKPPWDCVTEVLIFHDLLSCVATRTVQPEFKMLPPSSPLHWVRVTTEGETGGQPAQPLEQNALRFLNLSLSHWINCQGLRRHLFLFIWKITHSLTAEMASDKSSLWKLCSRTLLFHCLHSQKYSGEVFFPPPSLLSEAA